jgi:hypothetical protein
MVDLPIVMLVYQRVELNQQTPDRLSAEGRHGSPVIRIEGRVRMHTLRRMTQAMTLEIRTDRIVLRLLELLKPFL